MRPNIVLINCDDMGYGDLGCYGSEVNRTPSIDRMAENGLRFTDFYMASPVCSPSRGAMLTGCYPPRIGFGSFDGEWVLFPGQGVGLNPDETTLASLLRDSGYRTKMVGKWHCGDQPAFLPTRHGFDEYFGLPYSNDMGRQRTREEAPPLPLLRGDRVIQQQPDQRSLTERYVDECTAFIRENRQTPFFLYLAHMHVHLPLYAPARFTDNSRNGDYGACVECVDWSVACILHELEACGLVGNTLVLFTSDNGSRGDHGGSNAPLRGRKGTTWEGGQRVPLIAYWPGSIPPGICGELAASIDLLPTIARLSGTDPAEGKAIDGLDLSPLLFYREAESPRETFFYYLMEELQAVRWGDWKLHVRKDGADAALLYNLREDIGETRNLYSDNPEIVSRLEALLEKCREDLGDSAAGRKGAGVRPAGRVAHPRPLTEYDPSHPYIEALYDSAELG